MFDDDDDDDDRGKKNLPSFFPFAIAVSHNNRQITSIHSPNMNTTFVYIQIDSPYVFHCTNMKKSSDTTGTYQKNSTRQSVCTIRIPLAEPHSIGFSV